MKIKGEQQVFKYKIKDYSQQNRRMLPALKPSISKKQSEQDNPKDLLQSTVTRHSKGLQQAMYYQQKFLAEQNLNTKLKQLLVKLRGNMQTSLLVNGDEQQLCKLIKQRKKQQNDVQHQAHVLNILISQNNKLKRQVNSQRNKRAIYFNVYKNLQHEIHGWESKYKNLLVESLKAEGGIKKLQEKFRKATKKMQRDIQSLNEQLFKVNQQDLQKDQRNKLRSPKNSGKIAENLQQEERKKQEDDENKANYNCQDEGSFHTKKSFDRQREYQLQQKSIQIAGIINRLKTITGQSDIPAIAKIFKDIDQNLQINFNLFNLEEKREKQLQQKIDDYEKEIKRIMIEDNERKSTTYASTQLSEISDTYNSQIVQMQKNLTQKIGINVNELSNEMLLHHCLRIRDERKEGRKNLERYLQQTKKQKPEYTVLLNPKQMHKKIINYQTTLS